VKRSCMNVAGIGVAVKRKSEKRGCLFFVVCERGGRRIELRLRRCRGVRLAKAEPFAFYEVREVRGWCAKGLAAKWLAVGEVAGPFLQADGMGGDCGRGVVRLGLAHGITAGEKVKVEKGKVKKCGMISPLELGGVRRMGARMVRLCFNGS